MKTKFFYRSSPSTSFLKSFLMDKLESGFVPGMLAGTIEVPKKTTTEQKYWMGFSKGAESVKIDLDHMILVDKPEWSLAETPMGHLLMQNIWQINLGDNNCQAFLRDCNLPASTKDKKVCLFVSAGVFPQHWRDEMIYVYEKENLVSTKDIRESMRGSSIDQVFASQTIWGKDENLALVSTMHLSVLERMEEYDRLNYSKTPLNEENKNKLIELRDILVSSGIISREGKDYEFDKFRSRMHELVGPLEYTQPATKEMKQKREDVAQQVMAEIKDSFVM